MSDEEVKSTLEKLDTNHDGYISTAEFRIYLKRDVIGDSDSEKVKLMFGSFYHSGI